GHRADHQSARRVGPDLFERHGNRLHYPLRTAQTFDGAPNGVDDAGSEARQHGVSNLGFASRVAVDGGARAVHPGGQGVDVEGIQPVAHNEVGSSGVNAVRRSYAAIATNEPIISNHRQSPWARTNLRRTETESAQLFSIHARIRAQPEKAVIGTFGDRFQLRSNRLTHPLSSVSV